MEAASILLIWLRCHENRLMNIRVELFSLLTWIKSLQTMFLQCIDQNAVRHFNSIVQSNEVCVVAFELFCWNGAESAVEIVDGFNEVAGETLDRKVFCCFCFAGGAFLQVAEVGY